QHRDPKSQTSRADDARNAGCHVGFSEGSAADADAAYPPTIAVPEPLALPVAGTIRAAGIAGTVIAVARAVIAVGVVGVRDRAADNGAAQQAQADTRAPAPAAAPGMRRCRRRNGRVATATNAINVFFMTVPFSRWEPDTEKFHISLECSMNAPAIFADQLWRNRPVCLVPIGQIRRRPPVD